MNLIVLSKIKEKDRPDMIYIFDTSSLKVFKNFYPAHFPSLWEKFNDSVLNGQYISVKEVRQEIDIYPETDYLKIWAKKHSRFFLLPSQDESQFVSQIFSEQPHFQSLVKNKQILGGKPVADPFVIAKAKISEGTVVSEEKFKKNASKIPNVCKYFNIPHNSLKEFMKQEKWSF